MGWPTHLKHLAFRGSRHVAAPAIAEARKVGPEIMPLLRNLGIALWLLDTAQRPSKTLAYFDTRWLPAGPACRSAPPSPLNSKN
jgi:hypothetical protein